MSKKHVRIIHLSLLILALLLGSSACLVAKDVQTTVHEFSRFSNRIGPWLHDLWIGLKGISWMMANAVRYLLRGITGR